MQTEVVAARLLSFVAIGSDHPAVLRKYRDLPASRWVARPVALNVTNTMWLERVEPNSL